MAGKVICTGGWWVVAGVLAGPEGGSALLVGVEGKGVLAAAEMIAVEVCLSPANTRLAHPD